MSAITKTGLAFGLALIVLPMGFAQEAGSSAQLVLDQSAKSGKYTFLLFHRDDGVATKNMARLADSGLAKFGEQVNVKTVRITDPAEKPVVDRFDVSRAPMPMLISVGPNGAITGMWQTGVKEQDLAEAFVTPTMLKCMKSLQESKLVFVCVQTGETKGIPRGVKELMLDDHFKARTVLYSLAIDDTAERKLLGQMQIDPKTVKGTTVVFLAPPGVMIGKYDSNATMSEMAAALHKAGKCCDDPNCKHNRANQPQANQPSPSQKR